MVYHTAYRYTVKSGLLLQIHRGPAAELASFCNLGVVRLSADLCLVVLFGVGGLNGRHFVPFVGGHWERMRR